AGGKGWQKTGTTDSRVLWSWLTAYPNANYGIRTGTTPISVAPGYKIVVVDFDNRPEKGNDRLSAGDIMLRKRTTEQIDISNTIITITGSGNGSKHGFYLVPIDLKLSSRIPGVQIKAEGGMVVAPGSKHLSSRYYQFD